MPRILACNRSLEGYGSILPWFKEQGLELIQCDREDLLEQAIRSVPDVVLFGLQDDSEADMPTLRVLRRMLPGAPLIFLTERATLDQRRALQEFNPIFWALAPLDEAELREAVRDALHGRSETPNGSGRTSLPRAHKAWRGGAGAKEP